MGIRDHQLDALQPALDQALDKAGPERLRFGGTDPEADDLAPAVGRDGNSDYRGDRDDATALADFQVGGIEPQIRPLALDWPLQEGSHPLVNVPRLRGGRLLQSLETWLFEMPVSPIACTSSSTRRVETPPIQASWMTATSAFSAILRGSRNGGKYEPPACAGASSAAASGCAGSSGRAGCQRCGRGSRCGN